MTRLQLFLASLSLSGFAAFVTPALAQTPSDPPPQEEQGRAVARLSLMNGDASVRRGDSGEWVAASVNAPLLAEDSIHVAPGGYAEVQFDHSNYLRVAGDSEARISTLDNGRYGVQVIKGLVTFRVLRQNSAMVEVATPQVAVRPGPGGAVRVELLAEGYSRISVRTGDADVFTPKGVEKIRPGSLMMVRGSAQDPEFQVTAAAVPDEWDQFNDKRDRDLLAAKAYQYVSPEVSGAEDLDQYGHWATDAQYGSVWVPTVAADWAPYRSGRWVWEDFYGWTWVAYEPWGWAPYHYGSWYHRAGLGWAWYPGAVNRHHYWRPALVAFFGYGGFGVGIGGGIGWVPLAPFEVYRPWYGRGWYGGRNVVVNNVTVVNNTNITNIYRNARVAGGVHGVASQEFTGGKFGAIRPLGSQQLQSASLMRGALPVQPSQANLRFSERTPTAIGSSRAPVTQNFASRMQTGSTRTPFTQQQSAFNGISRSGAQGAAAVTGTANSGGWQRFGSTPNSTRSAASAPPRPTQQSFASPSAGGTSSSAGWQRFGQPSGSTSARPQAPQQQQRSYSAPSYQAPQQRYSAPPQRYSAPQSSGRPVQVAPPMVQQRSAPAPSYSRPSGGSSAPARSSGGSSHSSGQGHSRR